MERYTAKTQFVVQTAELGCDWEDLPGGTFETEENAKAFSDRYHIEVGVPPSRVIERYIRESVIQQDGGTCDVCGAEWPKLHDPACSEA